MRTRICLMIVLALAAVGLTAPQADAASARLRIVKIQYDSPGPDTRSNASLNAEWVLIKNVGTARGNLAGYTVRDAAGHLKKLGTRYLNPGGYVYLRTGRGTSTSTSVYWGSGAYIWNNRGDRAYWRSPGGTLLQTCAWTSVGTGHKNCSY